MATATAIQTRPHPYLIGDLDPIECTCGDLTNGHATDCPWWEVHQERLWERQHAETEVISKETIAEVYAELAAGLDEPWKL